MTKSGTPPNILHIVHWSSGGLARVAQDLILADGGIPSRLIVLQNNGATIDPRVHCDILDRSSFFGRIRRLRRLIHEFRPGVIHVHSLTPLYLAVLLAPRSISLVRTIHSPYPHFHARDIRSRIKRALEGVLHKVGRVTVVCVSASVADSLPWASPKPRVIENGIDFERLQRLSEEPLRQFLLTPNAVTIISAGRLEREKNFTLLIRAFALAAHASNKHLELVILGEGSHRKLLEALINELHVIDHVHLLGHKPNPFPYLRAAHIYASTSVYEGLSLALIEAMAIGLPAVATHSSNVPDSLVDMRDLMIVKESEPKSFSEALLRLIAAVDLRTRISKNGSRAARMHYSSTRMSSEYLQLYRTLSP